MTEIAPQIRFREARRRLRLTPDEVAARSGIPYADVGEMELFDRDLVCCYSPRQLQRFCRVLKIRPIQLFADAVTASAISAQDLVQCIQDHCRLRSISLAELEESLEWKLRGCMEQPEKLLEDMTVDGLQCLCRELEVDWHRVLLSL